MSTVLSEDKTAMPDPRFAIVREPPKTDNADDSPMPNHAINPLTDYILKVMRESGLSYVDVARMSRRRGGTIGKSTVQQIAAGKSPNPGIFTLVELAWGLNRPVEEVIGVALGSQAVDNTTFQKSEWANLWEMSTHLPLGEQRIIRRFLQMLEREIRRLLSSD